MTSLARYVLHDKQTAVGITGAWMTGPRISDMDLKHGRGLVQHVSAADVGLRSANGSAKPAKEPVTTAPKSVPTMWFGKHKGSALIDVRENEPGYWAWCVRDVTGFADKVRKLGLLDDEVDDES